jgi:hypothetical protein
MSLQETDQAAAAVATHPRVALSDIEAKIAEKHFVTADDAVNAPEVPADHPLALLTLCVLVMTNGFTVVGKSAPASPENFNADLGKKFAYEDAIRQLWPLEGYALRYKLSEQTDAPQS